MALNASSRTPANGAILGAGSQSLAIAFNITGGYYAYEVKFFWRRTSGTWQSSSKTGHYTGVCAFSQGVTLQYNSAVEWYVTVYYVDDGGTFRTATYTPWAFYAAPDTTPPTITSVQPAAGSVAPGTSGVTFQATVTDNDSVAEVTLYVDGAVEHTWTTSGIKALAKKLTLGAHTYRWTAEDRRGNTADTGTVNITVTNGTPAPPSGAAITVPASVANLGSVPVSWPAFLDGNPEDEGNLLYYVEASYNGGAWAAVNALGITSTSLYWTPNGGLGTAQLRVKAVDPMMAASAWVTSATITILSSQSPTDPVLLIPEGGESWREGETHTIEWTPATHPEGLPVTYRIEFSADGTFTDAVLVAEGVTGDDYAWTLPVSLVLSDSNVAKLRIRAEDEYSKVSDWSTSNAFTVVENAYPTIVPVDLADEGLVSGNTPLLAFDVDDADTDALHVEVQLSVRPDFVGAVTANSGTDQTGWEEAADPYSTWTDVPSTGATAGNRVRWQAPPLRYDWYYLRARVTDGILVSAWTPTIRVLITPSGALPLTCTIGAFSYHASGIKAHEKTGGEASPLEFDVALEDYRADVVAKGASVSVGFVIGEYSRVWNGTVETVRSQGGKVHVYCQQDDAYLNRKLVTGDLASADVGANLAAAVDIYGAPLDNANMDTSLGISAPLVGDFKTLCGHLQEWSKVLGFMFWVDQTGSVWLKMPTDLSAPTYVLWEGYDGQG